MANQPKYGAIAALREAQQHPSEGILPPASSLVPAKRPKPLGKRSDPDWKQYSILLKKDSHKQATLVLRQKYDGTDISDLMQALLDQWLKSEE